MSVEIKDLLIHTQTLSVLFAEDNYDVRIQLVKLMENFFKHLDVEVDGLDAINRFEEYNKNTGEYYDLVITDLSMPKFSGIDFCKKIIELNPSQTILVISAHTESEKLLELIDLGVFKFLQKPVNYKDLISTISLVSEKIKKDKENNKLEKKVEYIRGNNEILNKLANIDKLTSVYNRRYLDLYLLDKITEIQNNNTKKLSIIFLDIDDFKNVNDNYGHILGDEILISFTQLIKESLTENETFGRWGSEEFIIIKENSLEKSLILANRTKEIIEKNIFIKNITLTASFGVASYNLKDSLTTFIQKADYCLYQAKKSGKNQIYSVK